MATGTAALSVWRAHWPEYLIEAAGLGLFMTSAAVVTTVMENPASPLRQLLQDPLLRRALIGLAMGLTAVMLIYSPWGRRSGAHLNPAVTLSYLRLGRIRPADAAGYIVAQCVGGVVGVELVARALGPPFTSPPVNWVATLPGDGGLWLAFGGEALISAILMSVILTVSSSKRYAACTGLCAGFLVATFITLEAPWSGMSMNPARSLASAVPAGMLQFFWIYLLAPPLGMLAAVELHLRRTASRPCAKLMHCAHEDCIHCGQRGSRARPLPQTAAAAGGR